MYLVVACSRCRRARVVQQGRKSAPCAACGRSLDLPNLRAFHQGEDLGEAQNAAGLVNAKLAGREREFAAAFIPAAPREVKHDDAWHAAAAAARKAESESDRADAAARALSAQAEKGFTEDDFGRALALAGVPMQRAAHHLGRMVATQVVYEPRPGRYRAL